MLGQQVKRRRRPARWVWLLVGACALVPPSASARGQEEQETEPPSPIEISRDDLGNELLSVDHETQAKIGLTIARLEEKTLQREVTAFGVLEEDPAQSFTVRAPVTGYLRSASGVNWPGLGEHLEDATAIAAVEPRLTPTESLDVLTRWMDARAEVDEVSAELEAARASFESKKRLNEEGKLVSDRSLEEAEAKFKSSEARLAAVRERVEALDRAMPSQGDASRIPLIVARGGEVVELTARPDEAVESGQAVLRVTRFDMLVARVGVPVGEAIPNPLSKASLTVAGRDDLVLSADPIGRAPITDATTRGDTLLFRISVGGAVPLRPGTPVTARIPAAGGSIAGTLVPRSAILRYAGLAWVYVAISDEQFSRRAVNLVRPLADGWFVSSGVIPGDRVVISGAQSLLSEELKAQIESEEAAEE